MKRRPSKNAAQWADIISAYEASELTKSAFCREHRIGMSTLDNWRRRLSRTQAPTRTGFISVQRAEEIDKQVTLEAPTGVKISCPVSMGLESISRLARLIIDGR